MPYSDCLMDTAGNEIPTGTFVRTWDHRQDKYVNFVVTSQVDAKYVEVRPAKWYEVILNLPYIVQYTRRNRAIDRRLKNAL